MPRTDSTLHRPDECVRCDDVQPVRRGRRVGRRVSAGITVGVVAGISSVAYPRRTSMRDPWLMLLHRSGDPRRGLHPPGDAPATARHRRQVLAPDLAVSYPAPMPRPRAARPRATRRTPRPAPARPARPARIARIAEHAAEACAAGEVGARSERALHGLAAPAKRSHRADRRCARRALPQGPRAAWPHRGPTRGALARARAVARAITARAAARVAMADMGAGGHRTRRSARALATVAEDRERTDRPASPPSLPA
jgi:hypothetical protein